MRKAYQSPKAEPLAQRFQLLQSMPAGRSDDTDDQMSKELDLEDDPDDFATDSNPWE